MNCFVAPLPPPAAGTAAAVFGSTSQRLARACRPGGRSSAPRQKPTQLQPVECSYDASTSSQRTLVAAGAKAALLALAVSLAAPTGALAAAERPPEPGTSDRIAAQFCVDLKDGSRDSEVFKARATEALDAMDRGDYERAETLWTDVAKVYPKPGVYKYRAAAKLKRSRDLNFVLNPELVKSAIADLEEADKRAQACPSKFPNVFLRRDIAIAKGHALQEIDRDEEAEAAYALAVSLDGDSLPALLGRADALSRLNRYEDAERELVRAAAAAEDDPSPRVKRGLVLFQLGQREKALQELRGVVRQFPKAREARAALVAALWDAGKSGEAVREWKEALKNDPRAKVPPLSPSPPPPPASPPPRSGLNDRNGGSGRAVIF
eukprot:tig00020816_g14141.t1